MSYNCWNLSKNFRTFFRLSVSIHDRLPSTCFTSGLLTCLTANVTFELLSFPEDRNRYRNPTKENGSGWLPWIFKRWKEWSGEIRRMRGAPIMVMMMTMTTTMMMMTTISTIMMRMMRMMMMMMMIMMTMATMKVIVTFLIHQWPSWIPLQQDHIISGVQ